MPKTNSNSKRAGVAVDAIVRLYFMTESKMQKIDDVVEPLVGEIMYLMKCIEHKLPCGGSMMYKRSPIRSVRSALKRIKEANDMLEGIE